jgi:hypothetical protein
MMTATSVHMKLAPMKMMAEQSRICKSYGLDVWMWYPNMGTDYADEKTLQEELSERETVFAALEKLDAVFVPGGDPGELQPNALFTWLEKQAGCIEKISSERKNLGIAASVSPNEKVDEYFLRVCEPQIRLVRRCCFWSLD